MSTLSPTANQIGLSGSVAAIPAHFSIYLDLLRLSAAYFVVLFHMKNLQLGPPELLRLVPNHGHDAVIVFFVLSGYVISAATDRKLQGGLREYWLDRASRVYSVALPALAFSAILAIFFQPLLKPAEVYTMPQLARDTLINTLFLGQSWSLKVWVFFNQPYWSLCYEVMYYAGYGVFMFFHGWAKWLGLLCVAMLAGPKILLLAPCWIIGVLAYQYRERWKPNSVAAAILAFAAPVVILVILNKIGFGPTVRDFNTNVLGNEKSYLEFSNDFLIDYVTAFLVAINLYFVRLLPWKILLPFKKLIVGFAGMSFTMYLMHLPIIFLIINIAGDTAHTYKLFLVGAIGIPAVCYAISQYTEQKRSLLRQWLVRITPSTSLGSN